MSSAAGTTAHRTRAKNADAHPAADNKRLKEDLKTKELAALQGIERLANIQAEMEQAQASEAVRKPKPVRPRPVAAKAMSSSQPQPAAAVQGGGHGDQREGQEKQGQLTENIGEDDMKVEAFEGVSKLKPGKKSLRDAVNARLKSMNSKAAELAHVDLADRKGNSLPMSAVKSSYSGRIKAWASDVPSPSSCSSENGGSQRLISVLKASVPPSTIFSHSVTTATSNVTSISSKAIPAKGSDVSTIPISDLVGGFSDEDIDDSYERQAASEVMKTGRQPVEPILQFNNVTDSESEDVEPGSKAACYLAAEKSNGIPPPATQPRQPHTTQFASGMKWKLASGPSLETVESFDDLEESSLASLSFVGDTGMLIDSDDLQGMQEPIVVDIKKAPRTTSSTTVMTTDAKVPPAKKVKTMLKVKTEQTDLSDTPLASTQVDDGPWVEMIKARSSYQNTDLPPACQDRRWPKVFLPTIYLWAGSQPNLWNISDDALLEAINHIFQVVYPEVKYAPSLQGSVFGVTNQRLSEWRSNFGSTAIAIIIDFMAWNDDANPSDLAEYLLSDFAFLYEDPDVIDKMKTFRSPFMLQLVATGHLQATIGHANVPALNTEALTASGISGVVGIAAAALEHALKLIKDNVINIEDVLAAPPAQHKLMVKTPKVLNKATGKETSTAHAFSVNNWGPATHSFSKLACLKGKDIMSDITLMSWKLLKKSKSELEDFISDDNSEELDVCLLV
ncbi:uncharacterized protein F5891DRAFT_978876 [Suillus fuscotomentosus]|uniref:Uncharacterized protein n=1 Tax=Suillus fuscotomentosus TaxID=1912939 RepID=A0AAD4HMK9_9AGAM|nr:uncharacterized protein F5891DRAFT_978876 [Suillus fuscotomentosus]KAG1902158.1 hypothetical protein F5891DRAFT_978876 [Suillus fuscotomentosus]